MSQTELALRDRILADTEASRAELIELLRKYLAERYERTRQPVSADDAREIIARWGVSSGNWMGAVFRSGFECVGTKLSESPGRHASLIRTWRPK